MVRAFTVGDNLQKSNMFVASATNDATKSKKDALTANGAITRSTSGKSALDLFAICGSARDAQDDVVRLFSKAYADDKALALRIMLWTRDIRGGAGERQTVRNMIRALNESDPATLWKLIKFLPEFGRWDDVIESVPLNSEAFKIAANEVKAAIDSGNQLAAKWMPRKGAIAIALRNLWGMTPKQYRKYLVSHTNVVETLMCNKEWDAIEFDKLPSLAGLRYQRAFNRNAPARYEEFKAKLVKDRATINSSTLFPHNIVANCRFNSADPVVLNAQWNALPNYLGEREGKILTMCDVSGSMDIGVVGGSIRALDVSIGLGLYTSERLKGEFKDLILTFSNEPHFHKVIGNTISERVKNLSKADWQMNTNLQAAFELVLKTAKTNNIPASDMPDTILIISDMEFDKCNSRTTNFGGIKRQYAAAGYEMPKVVFWNVNGHGGNLPVKFDSQNTCMISGYSPAILDVVLSGKEFNPMQIMLDAVMKTRYDVVNEVLKTTT